jgi:hypothetical protein
MAKPEPKLFSLTKRKKWQKFRLNLQDESELDYLEGYCQKLVLDKQKTSLVNIESMKFFYTKTY